MAHKVYENNAFRYACLASALSLGVALFSIVIFISQTGFLVFKDVSWKEFFFQLRGSLLKKNTEQLYLFSARCT